MSHQIDIDYKSAKLTIGSNFIKVKGKESVTLNYTSDTKDAAKLTFKLYGGNNKSPFSNLSSPLTLTSGVIKTGYLIDVDETFKYSIAVDGHMIDPVIIIEPTNKTALKDAVSAIDTSASSFTLLGVQVFVDERTEFADDVACTVPFALQDLRVGDFLEVRGVDNGSEGIYASTLIREPTNELSRIEGTVSAASHPTLAIAGVTVTTQRQTGLFSTTGEPANPEQFFAAIIGHTAVACGRWNNEDGTLHAVNVRALDPI